MNALATGAPAVAAAAAPAAVAAAAATGRDCYWKTGKDPHPQDKSQYLRFWTLLRTPGRFTTRPFPVYFTTKLSVVRPFAVLSKDEIGP